MPEAELLERVLYQSLDDLFLRSKREKALDWIMADFDELKIERNKITCLEVCQALQKDIYEIQKIAKAIVEGKLHKHEYNRIMGYVIN